MLCHEMEIIHYLYFCHKYESSAGLKKNRAELVKNIGLRLGAMTDKKICKWGQILYKNSNRFLLSLKVS